MIHFKLINWFIYIFFHQADDTKKKVFFTCISQIQVDYLQRLTIVAHIELNQTI